jgi:signal transduction histidine kinase
VKDIELQSTILTATAIREISREPQRDFRGGAVGPTMHTTVIPHQRKARPRLTVVVLLSVLGLVVWSVGVFFYNINDFFILQADTWWFSTPTVNYLINTSIETLREQWIAALAIGIFSFTPLFRRAIADKLLPRDSLKLFVAFAIFQAIYVAQMYYQQTHELNPTSYGLFLVISAALLGGWRLGIQFGLVHALSLAVMYYFVTVIPNNDEPQSFLRYLLTETYYLVPIWLGGVVGYVGSHLEQKRFQWFRVLLLGLFGEFILMVCTVISSWAPPWYFERFLQNAFTTPLLLLAFAWLVYYHQSFSSGTLKMTQTELALAEAELKALRAQINPHFMLNSLSVIHHLVRTQPETARSLLLDLSDLFQHTLRAGDFVPLQQELEHVRAYLALEQARLTKRLNVMWAILAEDKLDTPVPTLILQPIIENAIVHGIAPKSEGGTVSILVKQSGDDLHIQVVDNGVGFDTSTLREASRKGESERSRPSIGFQNIDLRLRLLYGEAYHLQVASTPGAGTTVELKIPVTSAPVLEPTRDLVKA